MTLPEILKLLHSQMESDLIPLSEDDLSKLKAYMVAPDPEPYFPPNQRIQESIRGERHCIDQKAKHRSFHLFLKREVKYCEDQLKKVPSKPEKKSTQNSTNEKDEELFQSWKNSGLRTYAEYERDYGCPVEELRKVLNRRGKRKNIKTK